MRPAVLLAFLAAAACGDDPTNPPGGNPDLEVTRPVPGIPGLKQIVRVRPASPFVGDTVLVTTVLRNDGATGTGTLESSICGPGLRGSLPLHDPFGHCAGYSTSTAIAPGDSVMDGTMRVVTGPAGSYQLEVNHLRAPEYWAPLSVEVRAR